jgi:hypothetical protein
MHSVGNGYYNISFSGVCCCVCEDVVIADGFANVGSRHCDVTSCYCHTFLLGTTSFHEYGNSRVHFNTKSTLHIS